MFHDLVRKLVWLSRRLKSNSIFSLMIHAIYLEFKFGELSSMFWISNLNHSNFFFVLYGLRIHIWAPRVRLVGPQQLAMHMQLRVRTMTPKQCRYHDNNNNSTRKRCPHPTRRATQSPPDIMCDVTCRYFVGDERCRTEYRVFPGCLFYHERVVSCVGWYAWMSLVQGSSNKFVPLKEKWPNWGKRGKFQALNFHTAAKLFFYGWDSDFFGSILGKCPGFQRFVSFSTFLPIYVGSSICLFVFSCVFFI